MTSVQKTIAIGSVLGLVILIYLLKPILAPFLVGILIAYLGDPAVDHLEERGLGRTVAVTVVFLALTAVFVSVLLILVPMMIREVAAAVRKIPDFIAWAQDGLRPIVLEYVGVDLLNIETDEMKRSLVNNWKQAGGVLGQVVAEMTKSGIALITWAANLALIPIVAFYLMRDWDLLMESLRGLLPTGIKEISVTLVGECDEVLSAFLRGQLLIMFILGCVYAAGLLLIGLDMALLIGMLAGLASIVPYLGFIVGIAAASVAALFQFQDALHLFYVLAVFGVGQALEGWFLTPLLVGDRIGLHPVAVIFAILAGGQLFGFVGVLLALPVAAVIMVFMRHIHGRYRDSDLFVAEAMVDDVPSDEEPGTDLPDQAEEGL